ncbi:MAG: hypothetical protein ACE368_24460 [Paracoccaceae bacterium]
MDRHDDGTGPTTPWAARPGLWATLTVNADGNDYDRGRESSARDEAEETFSPRSRRERDLTASVTITITGVNDAPGRGTTRHHGRDGWRARFSAMTRTWRAMR